MKGGHFMCCISNKILYNYTQMLFSGRSFSVFVNQKLKDADLLVIQRSINNFTNNMSTDGKVLSYVHM